MTKKKVGLSLAKVPLPIAVASDSVAKISENLVVIFSTFFLDKTRESLIALSNLKVDERALFECANFLHRRFEFYRLFHNMPNGISEIKQCAMVCYAIKKYSPFRYDCVEVAVNLVGEKEKETKLRNRATKMRQYFMESFFIWFYAKVFEGIHKVPLKLDFYSAENIKYHVHNHHVSLESLIMLLEVIEVQAPHSKKELVSWGGMHGTE